jgi:hypothetical protein
MTAPGNATLLLTILAVFLGCTGYAAGRLHQWYRTGLDRDEAYRDGYDTGTRSTFSMAARIIGPRRDKTGIRASASVHAAGGRSGIQSPGTAADRSSATDRSSAAAAARSVSPPPASGRSVSPPPASARSVSAPPAAGVPSLAGEDDPPGPGFPAPVSTAFPAPPPFEFPGRAAPARLGSQVWSTGRASSASPAGSTSPGGAAADESTGSDEAEPPAAPKRHRKGRHFVPDELVRAVTYRLAPDRVARAKVHQAKRTPENTSEDGQPPNPAPDPASDPASHPASTGRSLPRPNADGGSPSRKAADEDAAPRGLSPKPRSS